MLHFEVYDARKEGEARDSGQRVVLLPGLHKLPEADLEVVRQLVKELVKDAPAASSGGRTHGG